MAGYHHGEHIRGAHVFIHGLVRQLRDRGHRVTFLQAADPAHRVLIEGVRTIYLGVRAKRLFPLRFALRSLESYDAVHTHYLGGAGFALRSRLHHLPMVAQCHVPVVPSTSLWRSDWRWRYVAVGAKLAPVRLTATRWLADALGARYRIDPASFHVIPYGVGEHWFRAAERGGERPGSPRVVLVNMKGVDVGLRAFAKVAFATGATLELFGLHKPEQGFEQLAIELGIGSRVRFRGFVANERLPEELLGAALVLHPNPAGNMDQVLLETQVLGIPAVTTRVGGNHECVAEGETARLCPVGDIDAFAVTLGELLGRRDLRTHMGNAARRHARERFHWTRVAARLEEEIYLPLSRGEYPVPAARHETG